jgi:hypothetical protein
MSIYSLLEQSLITHSIQYTLRLKTSPVHIQRAHTFTSFGLSISFCPAADNVIASSITTNHLKLVATAKHLGSLKLHQ